MSFVFFITYMIKKFFYIQVIYLQSSLSQQPKILAVMWIIETVLRIVIFLTLPEVTVMSNKQDISG